MTEKLPYYQIGQARLDEHIANNPRNVRNDGDSETAKVVSLNDKDLEQLTSPFMAFTFERRRAVLADDGRSSTELSWDELNQLNLETGKLCVFFIVF